MTRHRDSSTRPRRRGFWLAALAVVGLVAGVTGASATLALRRSGPAASTVTAGSSTRSGAEHTAVATPGPTIPSDTPVVSTPSQTPAGFTVLAAGDVLIHSPVNAAARTATGYDYGRVLAGLDPWVQGADLALCHLEVPIAPPGTKPSGYPRFGAPEQLLDGLKEQGWDGCSTASNHTLDRGLDGVKATISAFDSRGLGHVGSATTESRSRLPQLYELTRGGQRIRVAHLAQTYGTNGLPVPAGQPWAVSLIDTDVLVSQATAARAAGADLVIVSLHFGQEYQSTPTSQQLAVTEQLAASGQVDLVIGHHAHVPQEIVKLAGGPGDTGMWVAYGLGNMISSQDSACCVAQTDSGLMMLASVTKPVGSPAHVSDVRWQGITVDRLGRQRVHAFADIPKAGVGTLSAADVKARYRRVLAVVGTSATETDQPSVPTGEPPTVLSRDAG